MIKQNDQDLILKQNIINIPVIVRGFEKDDIDWEEQTDIVSYSKNSLGIILSRKYDIGRLLCLEVSEETDVESLTVFKEHHRIWGITQHCALISGSEEVFNVGLALIGINPPINYFDNPLQLFKLCGITSNGFWKVEPTDIEFITRKFPRFSISFEVFLGTLDDSVNLAEGEKVMTENISFGGAAVYSNLDLEIGNCVKFISAKYEFSALAVVRNITILANQKRKIHLEFIAGRFPLEKLKL